MYCSFFGFHERPFTLTPNPAFIFLSRAHQEAFAHLIYGIENRCGFIMLTGEVGAGKTTVIRTLLTELKPESHATALILNPMVSSSGLLRTINREFGISDQGSEPAELVEELHRFLLSQKQSGKATVLVIDEAQDMEPEVLEQVRLISNLETASEKLIQIILVGQPELEELLARPELRQLNQRITVRFHLTPMGLADTGDYLRHRLKTAAGGTSDPAVFSPGACKAIHRFAAGLPRLINAAADRALLIAYNHNSRQIDTATAKQAIADVSRSRKEGRSPARLMAWAAGVVMLLASGALALFYLPQQRAISQAPVAEAAFEQQITALSATTQTEQWQSLLTTLAGVWGSPPPVKRVQESPEQAIQSLGLSVYRYTGNLGGIIRLGYPALLECTLPPAGVKRYLLLTGIRQERAVLTAGGDTPLELPLQRLEQYWTGKALIPWDNLADLPVPVGRNATQSEREQLARLLNAAGVLPLEDHSYANANLRAAILRFQTRQGINPTSTAGVQTLMQLYRFSHPTRIPSLTTAEQNP
jgi:general secretion pathway protein A